MPNQARKTAPTRIVAPRAQTAPTQPDEAAALQALDQFADEVSSGTVTISVDEDDSLVHHLDDAMAEIAELRRQ